ncbi:polyprenyl synthetase family protein [Timonella sp. A28]|uniref:polyprenyl synthetase family protein n=1 Tax=Timonella sp. A28 TaxID=3442640 RepID=UPI003EBA7C19
MSAFAAPLSSIPPPSDDSALLVDVEGMRSGVARRLDTLLTQQKAQLTQLGADAELLTDAWRVLLSGGKRLRAAFAYWSYRAHQRTDEKDLTQAQQDALYQVGSALELFQAAALFHDDVMDRSDTRRGAPTAHIAFEAEHRRLGYVGEGSQYGVSTAILLGDLSLVASETEFRNATRHFSGPGIDTALSFFDDMRTTVTVGQFLDVHAQVLPWTMDFEAARERAFNIIRTKTSSYSVMYPLLIGAALAGADEAALTRIKNFGTPIGIAYQLLDDLLGVFGDPQATGKPAGDDLREGKRTVLVIEALSRMSPADRETLQSALGRSDLTDADIQLLRQLITDSGAVDSVRAHVAHLSIEGLSHLDESALNPVGYSMLKRLAEYALHREN